MLLRVALILAIALATAVKVQAAAATATVNSIKANGIGTSLGQVTFKPESPISPDASLSDLRVAVRDCRGCDIWTRATQTVFGEGAHDAEVIFVGEQPGNSEDLAGHPFVGPGSCSTGLSKRRV
jgi:hypothetical protein